MNIYKYLIYLLYREWLNDIPETKVIIVLSLVHFFQLISIFIILAYFFPQIKSFFVIFSNLNTIYSLLILVIFYGFNHAIFYNKKKWDGYVEEFKDESPIERRKRTIMVYFYFGGSLLGWLILLLALYG
jgi:hypothetical protein